MPAFFQETVDWVVCTSEYKLPTNVGPNTVLQKNEGTSRTQRGDGGLELRFLLGYLSSGSSTTLAKRTSIDVYMCGDAGGG